MSRIQRRQAVLFGLPLLLWAGHAARAQTIRPPQGPGGDAEGRIVLVQGRVEHAPAVRVDEWSPASVQQPLHVADRVRTRAASRAAILFIDETQIRLNADAVLTVQSVRAPGGASGSSLSLLRGEGWFRTKNPRSNLTIRTPAATAAIRGTEINVRIEPGDETVLTVVEGAAELTNPAGSVVAAAGEEARARPGEAPTKRTLLNPEDAVQWALYYPLANAVADLPRDATGPLGAAYAHLRANDAAAALSAAEALGASDRAARIVAAAAHVQLGATDEALRLLGNDDPAAPAAWRAERLTQIAAARLARGEPHAARQALTEAAGVDPTALRALLLLGTLELTQNRKDAAQQAADRALAAAPSSAAAHVLASEVAQAHFDLQRARRLLDRAVELEPDNVRALIGRARLRFGSGETPAARVDLDRAAALAPNDAQVRSLHGFVELAEDRTGAAEADFDAAIASDPAFGEARLGLGLVHFRQQRTGSGLEDMLTATLVEPKVALYQSYLGKAYYQVRRFPEGLAALDTAKRLDPRDPTPWLYSSLFLRDQNRQVDALEALREAIVRNDNRAVYRSRFLLDRDEATANVSLAEVYRQMGFEAWGAFEALNSLEADLTNASAHLFLGETYGLQPDRTQALASELLQFFLYAPVNRNTFNNFSEYASLLESPVRQLTATPGVGTDGVAQATAATRSGNQRFAHYAFLTAERRDGARPTEADERLQGFAQAKVSITSDTALFGSLTAVDVDEGEDVDRAGVFLLNDPPPVVLRTYELRRDPLLNRRTENREAVLGLTHHWRVGSTLTATGRYDDTRSVDAHPEARISACTGIDLDQFGARSNSRLEFPFRTVDFQAQQATRAGRHQFIGGVQALRQWKDLACRETIVFEATGETLAELEDAASARDTSWRAWVRDDVRILPTLSATVGLAWNDVSYGDVFGGEDVAFTRWQPQLGVTWEVAPRTVIRAAGFRHVTADFLGSGISPSTVGGFALERNEESTTVRDEADLGVERAWSRVFVSARAFVREAEVLSRLSQRDLLAGAISRTRGGALAVNWVIAPRLTFFGDQLLSRTENDRLERTDRFSRAGFAFLHPRGIIVRLSGSYYWQGFDGRGTDVLPRSDFPLFDGELTWEFASKHGLLTVRALNLLDRRLTGTVPEYSIERLWPDRRLYVQVRWRL